jgi:hypothetical protein
MAMFKAATSEGQVKVRNVDLRTKSKIVKMHLTGRASYARLGGSSVLKYLRGVARCG